VLPPQTQVDLLSLFSIENIPSEDASKVAESWEEMATLVIFMSILEHLDRETAKEFLARFHNPETSKEAVLWAKQMIPNLNEIVKKRLEEEMKYVAQKL